MLALLLLLLPCLAWAQPDTTWSRSFQMEGRCYLYDVVAAPNDIIVSCGYRATGTLSNPNFDYLLAGYTMEGESLYVRTYSMTEADEILEGIIHLGGDTVVAVGFDNDGRSITLLAFDAPTGDLLWERVYNPGNGLSKGRDITRLSDGRFAAVGYRLQGNSSDAWVLLCEANGDTIWSRTFGGASTDIANGVLQLSNGNLVVGGITRASQFSDYDQWTFEVNLSGNQVGNGLVFNGGDNDYCYSMSRDPLSNYWLIGRGGADVSGYGYTTVLPADGAPYSLTFSSPGFSDQFRAAMPWFGGMLFVGRSGNSSSRTSFLMRAIDEEQDNLWTWRYGRLGTEAGFNNISQLPDGGAIVCGAMILPEDTTQTRGYLLRISPPAGVQGTVIGLSDGQPVFGARVRAAGDDRFTITDAQGRYRLELAAGTYDITVDGVCIESDTSFGVVVGDSALAEVNFTPGQPAFDALHSSLNIVVENHVTGSVMFPLENVGSGALSFSIEAIALAPQGSWISVEPASGVIPAGDSLEIAVSVFADTTDDGVYDFFGRLVVHSNDCPDTVVMIPVLVTVLDAEERPGLPAQFVMSPAYPNPFNSNTVVTLELPQETELRLEVFNVQGRLISTVAESRFSAGIHNINIDLAGKATGIYLLRAQTAGLTSTQKLLFLR